MGLFSFFSKSEKKGRDNKPNNSGEERFGLIDKGQGIDLNSEVFTSHRKTLEKIGPFLKDIVEADFGLNINDKAKIKSYIYRKSGSKRFDRLFSDLRSSLEKANEYLDKVLIFLKSNQEAEIIKKHHDVIEVKVKKLEKEIGLSKFILSFIDTLDGREGDVREFLRDFPEGLSEQVISYLYKNIEYHSFVGSGFKEEISGLLRLCGNDRDNLTNLLSGKPFVGMPKDLLFKTVGPPANITSSVLKTKSKESYFYQEYKTNRGTAKYKTEIKIENDAVVGWVANEGSFLAQAPPETGTMSDFSAVDDSWDDALAIISEARQASISLLQRRLRIGYSRAALIIEKMEAEGIIGPSDGTGKPREVYFD